MSSEKSGEKRQENPVLTPRIEKVVVNASVGRSGEPLDRAMTILEELTGQKPCVRGAKKTIRDFGIRKKEPIACLVTLRGGQAQNFLRKTLQAVDNRISRRSFDRHGNFAFGIREHIDIPETKYSPELGIIGMDIAVTLGRAGYRVKRRRRAKSKIGSDHVLTPDEAVSFIRDEFGVEVT
ncbi:MAG: 50S ribosomal protein L5 [Candidatus Bathyarchaeota archaeon]|nr:50S ribosomal protein L5 [Candidatus Bathyarchaeota archaeon]